MRKLWTEWAFSLPSSQASFVERQSRKQRRDLSPCARPAAVFLLSRLTSLKRAELTTQAKQVFEAGDFVSINFLK